MSIEYESFRDDAVCLREDAVELDGFSLTYRLIKRPNLDHALYVSCVYDLLVTKRIGHADKGESAVIPAVSSVFERALGMYECMLRNTVTPMCVEDFFEEYQSMP